MLFEAEIEFYKFPGAMVPFLEYLFLNREIKLVEIITAEVIK